MIDKLNKAIEDIEYNLETSNEDIVATIDVNNVLEQLQAYKKLLEDIQEDKSIRNGRLVIKGTRIRPEELLLQLQFFAENNLEKFNKEYYDLTQEQIISAIRYIFKQLSYAERYKKLVEKYKEEAEIKLDKLRNSDDFSAKHTAIAQKLAEIDTYKKILESESDIKCQTTL